MNFPSPPSFPVWIPWCVTRTSFLSSCRLRQAQVSLRMWKIKQSLYIRWLLKDNNYNKTAPFCNKNLSFLLAVWEAWTFTGLFSPSGEEAVVDAVHVVEISSLLGNGWLSIEVIFSRWKEMTCIPKQWCLKQQKNFTNLCQHFQLVMEHLHLHWDQYIISSLTYSDALRNEAVFGPERGWISIHFWMY